MFIPSCFEKSMMSSDTFGGIAAMLVVQGHLLDHMGQQEPDGSTGNSTSYKRVWSTISGHPTVFAYIICHISTFAANSQKNERLFSSGVGYSSGELSSVDHPE